MPAPSQGSAPPAGGTPVIEPLRGRALRFVVVDELTRRPQMTVAEMVGALAEHGYVVAGPASKTISDALRWEILRGRRLIRLGTG